MNQVFKKWFKNRLLQNLPKHSVIVMDNASYHSRQEKKIPTKCSRKQEIINFMSKNYLDVPERGTKNELLQSIAKVALTNKNRTL